jgi:hypothetical protein
MENVLDGREHRRRDRSGRAVKHQTMFLQRSGTVERILRAAFASREGAGIGGGIFRFQQFDLPLPAYAALTI